MHLSSKLRLLVVGGLLAALVRRVILPMRRKPSVAGPPELAADTQRLAYAGATSQTLSGDDVRSA